MSGQGLIEVQRDADGNVLICSGCGTIETVASIRRTVPSAFTCCPERKMVRADAAPDLLAALETAMQWIKAWDVGFLFDDEWPEDEAKIRAAILKAKGDV